MLDMEFKHPCLLDTTSEERIEPTAQFSRVESYQKGKITSIPSCFALCCGAMEWTPLCLEDGDAELCRTGVRRVNEVGDLPHPSCRID